MLSKKSKYAINALIALAKQYDKGPLLISTIAEEEHIPKKFLEAILLGLRNNGILGSKKGSGGGYFLIKPPSEVKLSSIIRQTDGPIALTPCSSLNFYQPCPECTNEDTCGLRDVAIEVREASLKILFNTSLEDLLNREKKLSKSSTKEKASAPKSAPKPLTLMKAGSKKK